MMIESLSLSGDEELEEMICAALNQRNGIDILWGVKKATR